MKITEMKDIENCLDGTSIKDVYFDIATNAGFIRAICSKADKMQYFSDFPRPFFRAEYDGFFSIKGVEGEFSVRVVFKNFSDDNKEKFRSLISACVL